MCLKAKKKDTKDNEKREGEGEVVAPAVAKSSNIQYALKRLVRGLCSSRDGSRQGFATGLTMMLTSTSEAEVPLRQVLDLIAQETTPTGGMRGAEERDLLLGKLFGLTCCARGGFSRCKDTERKRSSGGGGGGGGGDDES